MTLYQRIVMEHMYTYVFASSLIDTKKPLLLPKKVYVIAEKIDFRSISLFARP